MPDNRSPFAGDKKHGTWFLQNWETRLRSRLVPLVPRWCGSHHLTLLTLVWSLFIVIFSFLARYNMQWLWGASVSIFLQYITDLLDGAIGRARNTGLIKWGFYMDHFLDYLFLCSILIGYGLLLPQEYHFVQFFVLAILTAFMVSSFLSFAVTNEFKISYLGIGPTEIRLIFITINTLLIVFGRTYLASVLPYVLVFSIFGLFVVVYSAQRQLWKIDIQNKDNP